MVGGVSPITNPVDSILFLSSARKTHRKKKRLLENDRLVSIVCDYLLG